MSKSIINQNNTWYFTIDDFNLHEGFGNKDGSLKVKFIYSEKVTKFWEIFTLLLSYVVPVKSRVEIFQNFLAFSEYMKFTYLFGKQ